MSSEVLKCPLWKRGGASSVGSESESVGAAVRSAVSLISPGLSKPVLDSPGEMSDTAGTPIPQVLSAVSHCPRHYCKLPSFQTANHRILLYQINGFIGGVTDIDFQTVVQGSPAMVLAVHSFVLNCRTIS